MSHPATITKTLTLTLVRHGQTTHNKLKIIQGQMDTLLTDLGRDQAKLLRDHYKTTSEKFDKIYSSDLTRAHETCQIICDDKYKIVTDQLLRERSFGVLQGSPMDTLREEAYRAGFNETNFIKYKPEGGETMEQVFERLKMFCQHELFQKCKNGDSVLIVTHGGVIREFFKLFKELGCLLPNDSLRISPNTGVSRFSIKLDETNQVQAIDIVFIHTIPHLEAIPEAKYEALNEEQLNVSEPKAKEEEYAV